MPYGSPAAERDRIVARFKAALRGDRPARRHGDDEPVRPARVQGRRVHVERPPRAPRRDRQGDARDRPGRRARRRDVRLLGRPRGHRDGRREGPARRARPLPRGGRRAVRVRRRPGLRHALRDRAEAERAARRHLPADRRARAALHLDARSGPEMVGVNPEVAHETMAGLSFHHAVGQALWAGKLFHIDLNAQRIGRYDQDFRFGAEDLKEAFLLVRLLERAGYDGPRHFDAHAYRNEDADGVWEFARGCMRTYLALAERARQFDALPEVQEALAAASAPELGEASTTLGADEADTLKAEADAARRAGAARLRQRGARPAARRGAARRCVSARSSATTPRGRRRRAAAPRGRAAHGGLAAERRAHDARAVLLGRRARARSSSCSTPGAEPGRERARSSRRRRRRCGLSRFAAERDADAEPAAGLRQRRQRALVARLGARGQLADAGVRGSRPAARSSAPSATRVSTQPRLPHAHSSPSGSTVTWPSSPPKPVRAAEQLAADDDAGADAQLARDVEEVAQARGRRPATARRARRGSPRSRRGSGTPARRAARAAASGTSTSVQPRLGATSRQPSLSTRPGSATTAPAVSSRCARERGSASPASPARSSSTASTDRARLSPLERPGGARRPSRSSARTARKSTPISSPSPTTPAPAELDRQRAGARPCRAARARSRAPARTRSARRRGSTRSSCSARSPARSRRASAARARRRGAARRRGCGAAPSAGWPA